MKTLTINDLSRTCELDRHAMTGVRGGMYKSKVPSLTYSPLWDDSKHDFSLDAQQLNSQSQDIRNNNGVNVAFAEGMRSKIEPTQTASNSLSF